nr:MAG TPA: hypothetical protein [Caudoviricetes sp.]
MKLKGRIFLLFFIKNNLKVQKNILTFLNL